MRESWSGTGTHGSVQRTARACGGTTYLPTPPKVGDGRSAGPGRAGWTEPGAWHRPSSETRAVGSISPPYLRRRGCPCRLPVRSARGRARRGGPPASEGRGDCGGKRGRLRSAEAARDIGPERAVAHADVTATRL